MFLKEGFTHTEALVVRLALSQQGELLYGFVQLFYVSVLLLSTIKKINGSLENMSLVLMNIAFNILQSDILLKKSNKLPS